MACQDPRVANPKVPASMSGLPSEEIYFGQTSRMQTIRHKMEKVADTDVAVLIEGENGTGKEVLARLIHARSNRYKGDFVKVNCAAIPGTLMESELFGYEKGAFTGAHSAKPGRVELAESGTLFLDEIGEVDLNLQAKLLQFLQDGHYSRIGGQEERRVRTRVVCATSRQLELEIQAGRFRADLFYRINVIHIKLPPLRERREDIPALAKHFILMSGARFQQATPILSREVLHLLQMRSWPGNIRELENFMARCVILGPEEVVQTYLQSSGLKKDWEESGEVVPLKRVAEQARRELERDVILKTLEENNWNRRKTAAALKISYRTLLYKLRDAGLSPRERKSFLPEGDSALIIDASTD